MQNCNTQIDIDINCIIARPTLDPKLTHCLLTNNDIGLTITVAIPADMEFSRLGSWSRDVSRPYFESLGLGLEH